MELIKRFRLSKMLNNCFLIKDQGKVILIDAPSSIEKVISYLEENSMTLDEVWLTHYHFDHVLGLNDLKEKFPELKVYIAQEEIECVNDEKADVLGKYIDEVFLYPHEILDNNKLIDEHPELKIAYISGHSKNSSVYIFEKDKIMFTGDVLFKLTIGRSDLMYGNYEALVKGIKENLLIYEDMEVMPGHGFKSSIKEEKEGNPFLNEGNNIL